jgi:hypothetical protein
MIKSVKLSFFNLKYINTILLFVDKDVVRWTFTHTLYGDVHRAVSEHFSVEYYAPDNMMLKGIFSDMKMMISSKKFNSCVVYKAESQLYKKYTKISPLLNNKCLGRTFLEILTDFMIGCWGYWYYLFFIFCSMCYYHFYASQLHLHPSLPKYNLGHLSVASLCSDRLCQ